MKRKVISKSVGAGGYNLKLSCGHRAWVVFGKNPKVFECAQCNVGIHRGVV